MTKKKPQRRGRGEGSVEELPDGRWRAILSLGVDSTTGKRRRKKLYGKTKAEALAKLRAEQARTPVGTTVCKLTVGEWLDSWIGSHRENLERNTAVWYAQQIKKNLKPRLGDVPLTTLDALSVRSLLTSMESDGSGPAARKAAIVVLRTALEEAVRIKLIPHNVAKDVKRPRVTVRQQNWLSVESAQKVLATASGDRQEAWWYLALDSGMRPGEMWALNWPELDTTKGLVKVEWSLEANGHIKRPKTKKSRRTILLTAQTCQLLDLHRERMRAEGWDVVAGPVFVTARGFRINHCNFSEDNFAPIRDRAGVGHFRPYDLRHSSATLLLAAGVNIKVISERLGHESIVITLQHYAHVLPSMQESARDEMEKILRPEKKR